MIVCCQSPIVFTLSFLAIHPSSIPFCGVIATKGRNRINTPMNPKAKLCIFIPFRGSIIQKGFILWTVTIGTIYFFLTITNNPYGKHQTKGKQQRLTITFYHFRLIYLFYFLPFAHTPTCPKNNIFLPRLWSYFNTNHFSFFHFSFNCCIIHCMKFEFSIPFFWPCLKQV